MYTSHSKSNVHITFKTCVSFAASTQKNPIHDIKEGICCEKLGRLDPHKKIDHQKSNQKGRKRLRFKMTPMFFRRESIWLIFLRLKELFTVNSSGAWGEKTIMIVFLLWLPSICLCLCVCVCVRVCTQRLLWATPPFNLSKEASPCTISISKHT